MPNGMGRTVWGGPCIDSISQLSDAEADSQAGVVSPFSGDVAYLVAALALVGEGEDVTFGGGAAFGHP